jgi:carboxypeptidase D
VVVNYPWDNTYDRHPLDELVKGLSLGYANLNPEMRNSRSFEGGITNGADWYVLKGGMQDWSYFFYNDLQITIELSRNKWPRYSDIPSYYKDNKESMLAYVKSIHQGAGFKLKKSKTSGRVSIVQKMEDGTTLNRGSYGFSNGEFFKVLPIGKYDFKVQLAGSVIIQELNFDVDTDVNQNGNYKIISEGL